MSPIAAPAPGALLDDTSVAWATAARWWAVFGGQRALLLQVAHPEVAAAVAEHSDWEARSLHRLGMLLLITFVTVHLYMVIREEIMGKTTLVSSMFSGYRQRRKL